MGRGKVIGYFDSVRIANEFVHKLNEMNIKEFKLTDLPEDIRKIKNVYASLRHGMIEKVDIVKIGSKKVYVYRLKR